MPSTTAAPPAATGQRYLHHEARGGTEPFVCLDFARYEGHEAEGFCAAVGERPLAWPLRGWRLEREILAVWLPVMGLAV